MDRPRLDLSDGFGPGSRGLLGFEQLAAKPDGVVIVCAGEKDLVHGLSALPEMAWVSGASGEGASFQHVASAFARRDAVMMYDSDRGGANAPRIAHELTHDARRVRVADLGPVLQPGETDVTALVRRLGPSAAWPAG